MDLQIDNLSGHCPVQAEGTIDGVRFYFRARYDHWALSVGADPVEISCGFVDGYCYSEQYGELNGFDAGWMDHEEAKTFLEKAAEHYHNTEGTGQMTNGKEGCFLQTCNAGCVAVFIIIAVIVAICIGISTI